MGALATRLPRGPEAHPDPPSASPPPPSPPVAAPPAARLRRPVGLLIDDPACGRALESSLAAGGFECLRLRRRDAAEQLVALRPHALIVELDLAAADALEEFAALRARTASRTVPILVLAPAIDATALAHAAKQGVAELLPRSVPPALVMHRLVNLLRMHDLLRGLRASDAQRRQVAQALPDTMLRVDGHGTIREIISVGSTALGLSLNAHGQGRRLDDTLPVPSDASFAELCAGALSTRTPVERELLRSDSEALAVIDFRFIPLNATQGLVVLREMDEHRLQTAATRRALFYDSLTGLPNRALFMSRLEQVLGEGPPPASVAVLRLQVDQFKRIDQSLGPAAADELLAEVGRRLIGLTEAPTEAAVAGGAALVMGARLGPDAFALLAVGLPGREACEAIADHIREPLGRPASINGREVRSTVSIGISLWPENGPDASTLLRNAALAANHARADGTARLYTDTMRLRSLRSLDIEQQLRRALENDELSLQYQPKVDFGRRRLIGFEALLRWESHDLGRISPAEIVPVAEQCGLITSLGDWVMRRAFADARRFQQREHDPVTVAINVSAGQFASGDLTATARRAADETGIAAGLIELELTESVLMQDAAKALRVFHELRSLGYRLSIDDFGTGYSSLQYLRRLPVDALKIDRSFVKDIPDDRSAYAICAAVIGLAKSLGLEVIAEGVENTAQAVALRARGCMRMQGYLIGRPMPATSVAGWIARAEWQRVVDKSEQAIATDY